MGGGARCVCAQKGERGSGRSRVGGAREKKWLDGQWVVRGPP